MLSSYLQLPRTIHILCLGQLINRAGSFLMPFLTIYLSRKLNLPDRFATGALGLFGLGSIIAALLGGHLADHIGRRRVMVFSLAAGATIMALFGRLQHPVAILAAIFAFALTIDMYRPASSAMIGDLVEPARRPQAFGLMYVAINLGFAIGAWVGGRLADYSFSLLFIVDAATTACFALIIFLAIPETLPSRNRREPEDRPPTPGDNLDSPPPISHHFTARQAAAHILRDAPFLVFCLANLLNALVFMQAMSTFPLFLSGLGFKPADYGQAIALNGLLIVLAQLPVTALLSRFHRVRMMIIGTVLLAIGFGANGLCTHLWQFALAIVVWTCGEMMQAAFSGAIVADLAPPALRARYMGVLGMSFAGSLCLGAPLGGEILTRFGGRTLWTAAACTCLVSALLYLTIYNKLAAARKPTPA